jgi:tRNA pseudouridine38-40 synthase
LKLTLAYDGAAFVGSQRQSGQRTVQEEVERAFARLYRRPVPAIFAGRTDHGVHAAGQVVSVADERADLGVETMVRALNANLPDDVAVVDLERVTGPFHARFDAGWREYRYRLWTGRPAPLARDQVWRMDCSLNGGAMRRAISSLVGEHDFAAFASGGEGVPWSERQRAPRGTRRRVFAAELHEIDPWWGASRDRGVCLEFRIVADAYLPRMVRNIVGVLVEIGRGVRSPEWVVDLFEARDRRQAGKAAPPHGLILWRVGYGGEPPATY